MICINLIMYLQREILELKTLDISENILMRFLRKLFKCLIRTEMLNNFKSNYIQAIWKRNFGPRYIQEIVYLCS
jgi:hypothetical protein